MAVEIRPFRALDAGACARLSAACARSEGDFVLNPFWETEDELFAEFSRRGIEPEEHLLVAEAGDGTVLGCSGFLRAPGDMLAGLLCPIVARAERGRGVGGELLRAALERGASELGIKLATAGIGTRNRAGYALLGAHGFRAVRQHFVMRCTESPEPPDAAAGVELAAAEPADLDAILEIYAACGFETRTPERMRRIFEDGRHTHSVARRESDGRIVAFAEIETHWPRRPWVAFVGVQSQQRERGIGSALVAWAVRRCFETGAESALIMLSPSNREGVRAYGKVGFRRFRLVDVLERGL